MLEWFWSKYEKKTFHVEEELFITNNTDRIIKILDAKYKSVNLKELTADIPQLTNNQWQQLYDCLNNRAALFDGALGLWKTRIK